MRLELPPLPTFREFQWNILNGQRRLGKFVQWHARCKSISVTLKTSAGWWFSLTTTDDRILRLRAYNSAVTYQEGSGMYGFRPHTNSVSRLWHTRFESINVVRTRPIGLAEHSLCLNQQTSWLEANLVGFFFSRGRTKVKSRTCCDVASWSSWNDFLAQGFFISLRDLAHVLRSSPSISFDKTYARFKKGSPFPFCNCCIFVFAGGLCRHIRLCVYHNFKLTNAQVTSYLWWRKPLDRTWIFLQNSVVYHEHVSTSVPSNSEIMADDHASRTYYIDECFEHSS